MRLFPSRLSEQTGFRRRRHRHRHGQAGIVSLSTLQPGQTGSISSVEANSKVTQRLADLGLTPETSICVLKTVPFNGPVEVAVRGSRLAVGKEIAKCIFVKMNEG